MMEESMSIPFVKMHGTGNDFILFDNRNRNLNDEQITSLSKKICQRRFGAGSDGFIALQFDETKEADLVMVFKNPDGSDAGMCGNGARCFGGFAVTLGAPQTFTFRVHQNIYKAVVREHNALITFPLQTKVTELILEGEPLLSVYTNTEHIVCSTVQTELNNIQMLSEKGRRYRFHEQFEPKGTNVNFIYGLGKNRVSLQTYERGVENLTYSCGTGAIASALGWHHLQQAGGGSYQYQIEVQGGTLTVHFSFQEETSLYENILLEGPYSFVYEGFFYV